MNITLCCNTLNEGKRLQQFLDFHKPYFSQIVIVDTGSTDDTVEICKKNNVVLIHDKNRGYCEPSRHIAALNSSNEWLLFLDIDEFGAENLLSRLSEYTNSEYDGYILERHNFLDGEFQQKESTQYRLFKKQNAVFNWSLHGGIEPLSYSRVGFINDAITHNKTSDEHKIDSDLYSSIVMNNPESCHPFWYLCHQVNAFPLERLLTMIVTTSAKYSASITHVEKLFESYNSLFGLTAVRKILVADGFHSSRNRNNLTYDDLLGKVDESNYNEYKNALRELCPRLGIELMELPTNYYMDGAILEATFRTSTPYYFYTPDDIVAVRDVDIHNCIKEMTRDLSIKRLYFNNYENNVDEFNWRLDVSEGSFPYLKTPNFSQNTHLGYTHHYNYVHGPVIRDIKCYPLELIRNKQYQELISRVGFDAAFRVFGTCLYGKMNDSRFTEHDFSYLPIEKPKESG